MTTSVPNPNVVRLEKLEKTVAEQANRIEKLEAVIAALGAVFTGGGGANAASDREMDHPQYGDPKVALIPRDWTSGGVVKGQTFSTCPPEFLDCLAETMDYFEGKNRASGAKTSNGKLKADYDKRTARYARGWARRLRSGWTPPERSAPRGFGANGAGLPNGAASAPYTNGGGFGSNGARPFANGSAGFGASRATPPPPASSGRSIEDDEDDDFIDTGTEFPFGANVAPKDEEEEAPL